MLLILNLGSLSPFNRTAVSSYELGVVRMLLMLNLESLSLSSYRTVPPRAYENVLFLLVPGSGIPRGVAIGILEMKL